MKKAAADKLCLRIVFASQSEAFALIQFSSRQTFAKSSVIASRLILQASVSHEYRVFLTVKPTEASPHGRSDGIRLSGDVSGRGR